MLSDLLQFLTEAVEQIVILFGAPGITLIAMMESLFPPTPSEALYPLAGKMAYDGHISVVAIVIAGTLGSLIGASIWYALGYHLGEERTRAFIARHGTLRLRRFAFTVISVEDFNRGLDLYRQHGGIIVLVGRLMPFIHGVVSIPAGVVHMNRPRFALYTALGSFLWIGPLSVFGYWLGSNWGQILQWLDVYENVWYIVIGLLLIWYIYHRLRARHSQHPDTK